jgi:hypothetical protein
MNHGTDKFRRAPPTQVRMEGLVTNGEFEELNFWRFSWGLSLNGVARLPPFVVPAA